MGKVIVEVVVASHLSGTQLMEQISSDLASFMLDFSYEPVEIDPSPEDAKLISADHKVVVVRGQIENDTVEALAAAPKVLHIWSDGNLEHFSGFSQNSIE